MSTRLRGPLLDTRELIAVLEPIFKLTEGDVTNPKSDVLLKFYDAAADYVLGPQRQSQWSFHSLAQAEYPELLHEPLLKLKKFRRVQKLFSRIHEESVITMNDLHQPEPKRTRRLLSSLANFIRYMSNYTGMLEGHEQNLRMLHAEERELDTAVEQRTQELVDLEAQRASEQAAVEELRKVEWEAQGEVEALLREWEAAKEEVVRKKERGQALEEEITAEKEAATRIRSETAALRQRLVASPDKLRAHVRDLEEQIAAEQARKKDAKEELRRRELRAEVVRKALQELDNRLELVGSAEAMAHQSRQLKAEVRRQRSRLEELQDSTAALRRSRENEEACALETQRKAQAQLTQLRRQQEEAQERGRAVEEEEREEGERARERRREAEELTKEISAIREAISAMMAEHDERMANLAQRKAAVRERSVVLLRQADSMKRLPVTIHSRDQ